MSDMVKTRLNRVYPAKRMGDTLIVSPKGDAAGFSVTAVNTEMAIIKSVMESGGLQHLIVDLSGSNYFGSVVLGALVQLGTAVRNRGGRIALAGASRDMQDILRLMKIDQMWELFPDTKSALRRISRIPLKEKLWEQRIPFLWLVGCLVLLSVLFLIPMPKRGSSEYVKMAKLWREVESRRNNTSTEEWAQLERQCSEELAPIIEKLEGLSRARGLKDAEPSLLYAARDYWIPSMQRSDPRIASVNREMTQYYLRCAEAILAGRPRPKRAVMTPTDSPDSSDSADSTDSTGEPVEGEADLVDPLTN